MRHFTVLLTVCYFVLVYQKSLFTAKKKDFTFLYSILIYQMNFI
jgi:hypothetical protein